MLDIGSGEHLWGRAVFHHLSAHMGEAAAKAMMIDGIDHDPQIVSQTNQQLRASRMNVRMRQMNMYLLPAELTNAYDVVHMRMMSPYVSPQQWSALLKELVQVCRPHGWLIWLEPLSGPTREEQADELVHWPRNGS
jgi:2-polyprenyl-3-methyl-5-hydroxy-6-metoxy-1,4-benzoquinol methylase